MIAADRALPPPLDAQVAEALASAPPQTAWDPVAMREAGAHLLDQEAEPPRGVTRTVLHVPTPPGSAGSAGPDDLELRIHTPDTPAGAVVVSIHGGGFVAGRARYDDAWNARMAARTGAVVVSPDYRLAPEHPYPAPMEDCLTAWRWAAERYPEARRVIYGDSAGGCLAAGVVLRCRDAREALPDRVVLVEPVLDDRLDTVSMRGAAHTPVWDLPNATASWAAYLGGARADTYAAPGRQADLVGFPPTFLLVNQCDPLMDEALAFAQALTRSGVPTEAALLAGSCHGILGLEGPRLARRARELVLERLMAACSTGCSA
ncbi:alpha/beta hydrolase [Actinomyces capricornis]|uniref:Alpha/beta hydrolase fold-3 domain-containing protein n=1 Tax=Actinomyces capricornis TaxID=2755559 RepID=A0ABM7U6W9_9ACTO|nr:alpha/beta hydrolase [Actinomyces capricornis]BDA63296.1 hypothetical protein MANAM107_01300 [Actinomyces capricornis]